MTVAMDEPHPHHHAVQFYEDEAFLAERVAAFLAEGARNGEPCVVIATPEHNAMFASRLESLSADPKSVAFLDARSMLDQFLDRGTPNADRFASVVGRALADARGASRRVRAYGEMVDLLWRDGEPDAAIRLEELWNDLSGQHTFSLLCAYPMGNFYKESDGARFDAVCATHTVVWPTERSVADEVALRDRRIAQLEQRAAALEQEVAHRKSLERRLADALSARRRSEELLRDFVDNATVGLHWVAADGTIEWTNDAELKLLGYTREEYVGRNIAEFHADRHVIRDILVRLSRNEEIHDYEAPLRAKDGSIKWVVISSNVLFEDGKFVHTRCFTRDITARKRLEEQNAFLLDAVGVIAQSLDYRTRLRELARVIVSRLADGCTIDIVRDEGYDRLAVAHAKDDLQALGVAVNERWPAPAESDPVVAALRSGEPQLVPHVTDDDLAAIARDEAHLRQLRKAGMKSLLVVPMHAHGRVVGAISLIGCDPRPGYTAEDLPVVTLLASRAGAMIEIARLYEIAEENNRAKDDFLATLSHELRTPLTAILGWARMLSVGGLDDETLRTAIATIEQSARTQAALIEDLLDVSRVVSGKLSLQSEPVDVSRVIADVLHAMHVAAEAKRIRVDVVGLEQRAVVQGDATRLQQIVWNLVSNAIKFSEEGARISVRLERRGARARIVVRDEGRGIAPSFLPFIFEPFRQADSTVTRLHGGLGLGLAIVRYLVEAHGGVVRAESAGIGEGATFTVDLPLVRRSASTATDADEVPDLTGTAILVVDDDESSRRMLKAAFLHCGADVEAADSAAAAREAIARRKPDVIVTDIAMPIDDGVALVRALRAEDATRGIPVIALTAFRQGEEVQKEFDAFLHKPIDPMDVARRIAAMQA
ncbi:MAG TPA: ATP-binding protein [Thermoanaerobaculia bacterium]|nr:ATP-binding protein [Thermoanaerobaculia bacterium]